MAHELKEAHGAGAASREVADLVNDHERRKSQHPQAAAQLA